MPEEARASILPHVSGYFCRRGVGLHKLSRDRKGQWAMTVNERWRICFEFRKGDAYEVEIVDYHSG